VHEDAVELAAEPHVAHVGFDVLGFEVQGAAHRQHAARKFDQGHREARLEVRGIAAPAAAQLEERGRRTPARLEQQALVEGRLIGVLERRLRRHCPASR
jgi:hypothetical protein